ncbi:hypothetical protein [Acidovorax sp. NCPPB 3576]|uniref:hypothetical protein n=1 Tax=Acidovorax sp. NCPPB 3576 TaxID=2940488 RepID=UPI00234B13AF|nr:hypothetical protein [Acidovorax sp. NCPPB 3576]WCM88807.1 hypothetical protein M5C98_01770 [Acidovorax sp. NCPPB 3576]
MNAVATAPPRKTRVTPAAKQVLQTTPTATIDALTRALESAWCATEVEDRADEASHILLAAFNVAEGLQQIKTDSDRESLRTIRALTHAAQRALDVDTSKERFDSILAAHTLLDALTDSPPSKTEHVPGRGEHARQEQPQVVQYTLAPDQHNSLFIRMDHALAVLQTLVHLFGGDAGVDEPGAVHGLHGALQHAQWLLKGLHLEIMRTDAPLPDDLRWRTFEASELIDLIEGLECANGFTFDRLSDALCCSYFSAAAEALNIAKEALEKVGIRAPLREAAL